MIEWGPGGPCPNMMSVKKPDWRCLLSWVGRSEQQSHYMRYYNSLVAACGLQCPCQTLNVPASACADEDINSLYDTSVQRSQRTWVKPRPWEKRTLPLLRLELLPGRSVTVLNFSSDRQGYHFDMTAICQEWAFQYKSTTGAEMRYINNHDPYAATAVYIW